MLEFGAANVQEDSAPLYGALMLSLRMQNLVFFLVLSHALYSSVDSQQCEHGAVKLVSVINICITSAIGTEPSPTWQSNTNYIFF